MHPVIPCLHDGLCARGAARLQTLMSASSDAAAMAPLAPAVEAMLSSALALSEFVAELCQRQPALLADILASGDLLQADRQAAMRARADALLIHHEEAAFMTALRQLRQRELLVIAVRDLSGQAAITESVAHQSALADVCIRVAMDWIEREFAPRFGHASDSQGRALQLVILGMGKLGGGELNFSSDIDLVFAYGEEGETSGPRKLEHSDYFTRVGQKLIQLLSAPTHDGFVFRVDMRLRPYGDSGPLALSLDALEEYYQDQGREWERFAFVKARILHGDTPTRERLQALIKPFVYRRYIDYSVLEAIRRLKGMINQDLRRKQRVDNIKLGQGGIREIEFIVQAFQLIRGGREPRLQNRALLPTLAVLAELELLQPEEQQTLEYAYRFLRKLENALQAWRDEQTQTLAQTPDAQAAIAAVMGCHDDQELRTLLQQHTQAVHAIFQTVFGQPTPLSEPTQATPFTALWLKQMSDEDAQALLAAHHFADAAESLRQIQLLRDQGSIRQLSARGRQRLDALMPALIAACAATGNADLTLQRVLELIRAISRRTAYLELLSENPAALTHLTQLCGQSPFVADLLRQYPILLDDLLDTKTLYAPPAAEQLRADLQQSLLRVGSDDLEQQLDTLREFRHSHMLRIAACALAGSLDVARVSEQLTQLAEALLREVLELAWLQLTAKHGAPPDSAGDKGFAIIAYGKFGGGELSFASDLDLVFLHRDDGQTLTSGDKPLALEQFYTRLAQRMLHLMTTRTPAGILYEIDTRLRPSGQSGLLVCSLSAFAHYQRADAWTWEHQALVRARAVGGSVTLAGAFHALRDEILQRPREAATLAQAVADMRARMRVALDKSTPGRWDLKHGAGGIVDIEFLVQYWVLRDAPALSRARQASHSGRLLQALADCGAIEAGTAASLISIYRRYREEVNRLALAGLPAQVEDSRFRDERARVAVIWSAALPAAGTPPA